jgi:hypothetical protein
VRALALPDLGSTEPSARGARVESQDNGTGADELPIRADDGETGDNDPGPLEERVMREYGIEA